MAVYLGETDETKIDEMSIVFFNNVLSILGKKVNYDAVVNYAGNSFAKDAWKTIQEANPLIKHKPKHSFADMFAEVPINQVATKQEVLPGKSWFKLGGKTEVGEITNSNNNTQEQGRGQ